MMTVLRDVKLMSRGCQNMTRICHHNSEPARGLPWHHFDIILSSFGLPRTSDLTVQLDIIFVPQSRRPFMSKPPWHALTWLDMAWHDLTRMSRLMSNHVKVCQIDVKVCTPLDMFVIGNRYPPLTGFPKGQLGLSLNYPLSSEIAILS